MGRIKRGVFFSVDAIIAISIILLVLLVLSPISKYSPPQTEIHRDILKSLSTLKIGEIDNEYVQTLIANGEISDLNKSVIEQIGEFYVSDVPTAQALANSIISDLDLKENIGIWFGDTLLASSGSTPYANAEDVDVARQVISGIKEGGSVSGFSARAFLTSGQLKKYFFFGGYVGDGNLTARIEYEGVIDSAEMEIAANKSFELFVNNISQGNYPPSLSAFTPREYTIPITNFESGTNLVELRGENVNVAGGFIKIMYSNPTEIESQEKYYFPGIKGLINLYDGLPIPGALNSMKIFLHLNSPYLAFLNIGNVLVFNDTTDGEETITLENAALSSILNYPSFANKTIPIRFGLENVSLITSQTASNVDVASVADGSGSMAGTKMTNTKNANKLLAGIILNVTNSAVGLVRYDSYVSIPNTEVLSTNSGELNNSIDDWIADGATCICCGIDAGRKLLTTRMVPDLAVYLQFESGNSSERDSVETVSPITNSTHLTYTDGVVGKGANFNGNSYLSTPTSEPITDFLIEDATLAFWIKTNQIGFDDPKYAPVVIGAGSSSSFFPNYHAYFGWIDSTGRIGIKFAGGTSAKSSIPINDGIFHHIALTKDDLTKELKVYVDGILSETTGTAGTSSIMSSKYIGYKLSPSVSYLNAVLDDLRIYTRVLPQSEIQSLANPSPVCGNLELETGEMCEKNEFMPSCGMDCKANVTRKKDLILMTDGEANVACSTAYPGLDSKPAAIAAACKAHNKYNVTVHGIAMIDPSNPSETDTETIQAIAECGEGIYAYGTPEEIMEIYTNISNSIIEAAYKEQTLEILGNAELTTLFSDSYIEMSYDSPAPVYGMKITNEREFTNATYGTFEIPVNSSLVEAKVTSYSGARWTDKVLLNNQTIYELSSYGPDYTKLGDPYMVSLPTGLTLENNTVEISTGNSPSVIFPGSASNKIIYVVSKNITAYSKVSIKAEGCIWTIEFEDSTFLSDTPIPETYLGTEVCNYTEETINIPSDDATQTAVLKLLRALDFDSNGKIDTKITDESLEIDLTEITGIPFSWETEVQIRSWH